MPRFADAFDAFAPHSPSADAPPAPRPAKVLETDGPKLDLTSRLYMRDDVVGFCRLRDEWGVFSNFMRCNLEAGGANWRSSEALYQALRFPHSRQLQEMILRAPDPFAVKAIARAHDRETRADWGVARFAAMAWVLGVKAEQFRAFARELAASGHRPIVEISKIDDLWGAKPNGGRLIGVNALGQLLELCRSGRTFAPPQGSALLGQAI